MFIKYITESYLVTIPSGSNGIIRNKISVPNGHGRLIGVAILSKSVGAADKVGFLDKNSNEIISKVSALAITALGNSVLNPNSPNSVFIPVDEPAGTEYELDYVAKTATIANYEIELILLFDK